MGKREHPTSSQKVTGFILIALGGLFLLDTLDFLNFGRFIGEWWPAILIIIGLAKFRGDRQPGGGILIVLGSIAISLLMPWITILSFN